MVTSPSVVAASALRVRVSAAPVRPVTGPVSVMSPAVAPPLWVLMVMVPSILMLSLVTATSPAAVVMLPEIVAVAGLPAVMVTLAASAEAVVSTGLATATEPMAPPALK